MMARQSLRGMYVYVFYKQKPIPPANAFVTRYSLCSLPPREVQTSTIITIGQLQSIPTRSKPLRSLPIPPQLQPHLNRLLPPHRLLLVKTLPTLLLALN